MKVAQILYSGLGGHGSVAFSLVEGDAERRWSNVLGFLGIEPLLDDYRQRSVMSGIPLAYFEARRGRPWATWPALYRWLNEARPDAIICHSGPALLPSSLQARRRGACLIAVEHTSIPARKSADMFYTRIAMRLADAVIVLTPELASGLHSKMGSAYNDRKVSVIPTGINTERFHPSALKQRRCGTVRLGMAGRLTEVKRHDQLVAVVRELQQLRPDRQWTLSIAGDGEERRQLESLAHNLPPGSIEFTGTLPEQALADWYRSLDLYVHASKAEALSTAILQAMATQLPIVASEVPGIVSLLPPNAGILQENGNARGWAAKIADLADSKDRMDDLGRNARQLCVREYSHCRMHKDYDALIRRSCRRP